MQCFKLAAVSPNPLVLPPSEPQLFAAHTSGDFEPACFSPDGTAADQGGQSPVLAAHLRLLAAGVPSLFQWDETTCKHTHLTFFTTVPTTPQAEAEAKAVLSTPGLEGECSHRLFTALLGNITVCFLAHSDGKHTVGMLRPRLSVPGVREPHRVVCTHINMLMDPLVTKETNNQQEDAPPLVCQDWQELSPQERHVCRLHAQHKLC